MKTIEILIRHFLEGHDKEIFRKERDRWWFYGIEELQAIIKEKNMRNRGEFWDFVIAPHAVQITFFGHGIYKYQGEMIILGRDKLDFTYEIMKKLEAVRE